ncbi:MAG: CtsR family transcriptional regulator [Christensenellales bacterium]|jgi:transcriptional regulator CtsR
MSLISDSIERFIQALFEDDTQQVEIQRNELAAHFNCAPSQINYVLATRFTIKNGYQIESRRGGGGYIRILRLSMDEDDYVFALLTEEIGDGISAHNAHAVVDNLMETGCLNEGQAKIMHAALSDNTLRLTAATRDALRARLLKAMILAAVHE